MMTREEQTQPLSYVRASDNSPMGKGLPDYWAVADAPQDYQTGRRFCNDALSYGRRASDPQVLPLVFGSLVAKHHCGELERGFISRFSEAVVLGRASRRMDGHEGEQLTDGADYVDSIAETRDPAFVADCLAMLVPMPWDVFTAGVIYHASSRAYCSQFN